MTPKKPTTGQALHDDDDNDDDAESGGEKVTPTFKSRGFGCFALSSDDEQVVHGEEQRTEQRWSGEGQDHTRGNNTRRAW